MDREGSGLDVILNIFFILYFRDINAFLLVVHHWWNLTGYSNPNVKTTLLQNWVQTNLKAYLGLIRVRIRAALLYIIHGRGHTRRARRNVPLKRWVLLLGSEPRPWPCCRCWAGGSRGRFSGGKPTSPVCRLSRGTKQDEKHSRGLTFEYAKQIHDEGVKLSTPWLLKMKFVPPSGWLRVCHHRILAKVRGCGVSHLS